MLWPSVTELVHVDAMAVRATRRGSAKDHGQEIKKPRQRRRRMALEAIEFISD